MSHEPPSRDPRPYRLPYEPAVRFFRWYFRRQFAKHFTSVRWHAVSDPATWDEAVPTLCYSNHTNWWDGFLSSVLTWSCGQICHVLMEAEHLDRYAAFKLIGTLPVERRNARAAVRDLDAARSALRPRTWLWIYPQGQRRPALEPPTRFERGIARLAEGHAFTLRVVPVAFRYVHLGEQLPEAFALLGEPEYLAPGAVLDRTSWTAHAALRLAATVEALDARLAAEALGDFRELVAGKLSINKRMDRVRHATGLLDGPFEARNG